MNGFPTRTPGELEACAAEHAWLVEALWTAQGVGIVGGEPKTGKTFLALHIAVAVAAGVPCLQRFPTRAGPVLLFAAEDAPHILRQRLDGIAAASGAALPDLNLHVIDTPSLRLDDPRPPPAPRRDRRARPTQPAHPRPPRPPPQRRRKRRPRDRAHP